MHLASIDCAGHEESVDQVPVDGQDTPQTVQSMQRTMIDAILVRGYSNSQTRKLTLEVNFLFGVNQLKTRVGHIFCPPCSDSGVECR